MARIRLEVCETPNRCREILLVKPIATIGRGAQCDVRIGGDAVSSQHAKLRIYSTHAVIQDADSLNGVLVNGQRIHGPAEIGQGAVIQLGPGGPTVRILDGVPPVMAPTAGPASSATPIVVAAPKTASTATYWVLAACAGMAMFTSCTAVVVAVAWYAATPSHLLITSLSDEEILADAVGLVIVRHKLLNGEEVVGQMTGTGTAFSITPDGHMVTNRHVVEVSEKDLEGIQEELKLNVDGVKSQYWVALKGRIYDAALNHQSSEFDFAMLSIERSGTPYFAVSELTKLDRRTAVVALGFPGAGRAALSDEERLEEAIRSIEWRDDVKSNFKPRDFDFNLTEGKVTRMAPEGGGRLWVAHDTSISPGNSGGPLCLDNGAVIAINTQVVLVARDSLSLMMCQLREEIARVTPNAVWTE